MKIPFGRTPLIIIRDAALATALAYGLLALLNGHFAPAQWQGICHPLLPIISLLVFGFIRPCRSVPVDGGRYAHSPVKGQRKRSTPAYQRRGRCIF